MDVPIQLILGIALSLLFKPVPVVPAHGAQCLVLYGQQQIWQYCDPDAAIRSSLIRESFEPGLGAN